MTLAVTSPSPPSQPPQRRFTVAEYHRMIETGVLTEQDAVELLEGWVVFKMARHPRHDNTLVRLERILNRLLGPEWVMRGQSAITTDESEPEPDVAVVRGPVEQYDDRHPAPADVALVVEVAAVSLTHDRTVKARIYARAQLPEYWIVNVNDIEVEVYRDPSGPVDEPGYGPPQVFRRGQTLSPLGLDIQVPVDSLF
jgi:Uma2 family endonuclease